MIVLRIRRCIDPPRANATKSHRTAAPFWSRKLAASGAFRMFAGPAARSLRRGHIVQWRDQVAVVTGSARGLGRATARLLAQRGAAVCVNYAAQADAAEALIAEIAAVGGRAIAVAADVADAAADDAEVARMRQVNVDGVIYATRAVMGGMRTRRYGRIVNVSSIAAIGTALPGNAFAATKAEVLILTRRFAMELGPHGISVNAVAPGFVRTDMTQRGRGAADWQGTEQRLAARAMMGRIGEPQDIANAVAFLVSPESGWITAQTLTVDGGRMDYIGHG